MDEEECKKAVKDLGLSYYGSEINSYYPSGCYAYKDIYAYFNKHESGTGNANAKGICKQGDYQFIHNQSLSKIKYMMLVFIICHS